MPRPPPGGPRARGRRCLRRCTSWPGRSSDSSRPGNRRARSSGLGCRHWSWFLNLLLSGGSLIETAGVPESKRSSDGQELCQPAACTGVSKYIPVPTFQLALRGVTKFYGRRLVLDEVSLSVRPGEHLGVVGDNGAGKSTLLRLMAGLERPNVGRVTLHAGGSVGYLS